ncbi:MAG: galactitol-1-phosphate 5-dehydrogenase [Lachnospiraceae bacterium]|nr:galactitol-1-phosphate 5-dehydrogenase [Lachnospiraceae bacterium]
MKAYVLHGINDLRMEERAVPEPGPGQVLVQVKAAGICGSDIPRIFRTGTYSFPTIPGHEFSGVVAAMGPGVPSEWTGKRVGIFPLIPCRECAPCRQKHYELCRSYSYLGSRTDGGFAEYALAPWESLIELPEGVSFGAAAMLEPMAVAVHALRRAQVSPGKTVAVYGQGTIGLLLSMFLRESGIERVLAIGNKAQQRRSALDMGIAEEDFCDTRTQEMGPWLAEKTGGAGVDVFFECIGRNETIGAAIDLTAPMGTTVLVGNPSGDVCLDKAVYWKILRNQLTVMGCWNSSFTQEETDDWHYVLERLAGGRIQPERLITHLLPFERLPQGLEIMRDKSEEYVKVMTKL